MNNIFNSSSKYEPLLHSTSLSSCVVALESRYIFDAAAVASGADMTTDIAAQSEAMTQITDSLADNTHALAPISEQVERLAMATMAMDAEMGKTIVFIDAHLGSEEIATLKAGIADNAELHLINADADALVQMAAVLNGYQNVQSVHILSHGSAGMLSLGNADIDFTALTKQQKNALIGMNAQLAEDADLLIYGCDFGAGELGKTAMDSLANLTGADIAASDDITGLGGDWDLEVQTGIIETQLAFSSIAQENLSISLTNSLLTSGSTKLWLDASNASSVIRDGDGNVTSWHSSNGVDNTATAFDGSATSNTYDDFPEAATYDDAKEAVVFSNDLKTSFTFENNIKAKELFIVMKRVDLAASVGDPAGKFMLAGSYLRGADGEPLAHNDQTAHYHYGATTTQVDLILATSLSNVKGVLLNGQAFSKAAASYNTIINTDNVSFDKAVIALYHDDTNFGNINQFHDRFFATRTFGGDMHEYIVLDVSLSSAGRHIVNNYLATKWDITLNAHDYYNDAFEAAGYKGGLAGILHDGTSGETTNSNEGLTIKNTAIASGGSIFAAYKTNALSAVQQAGGKNYLVSDREWNFDVRTTNSNATTIAGTNLTFNLATAGLAVENGVNYSLLKSDGNGGWTSLATSNPLSGNEVTFSNVAIGDGVYRVASNVPTITDVTITHNETSNTKLNAGDEVTVTVIFDENVTVNNTPEITLDIGGTEVQAKYAGGSGSNSLTFNYTILDNQADKDGITVKANSLAKTNGSTIRDASVHDAVLTYDSVINDAIYHVDNTPPTVALLTNAPSSTLKAGETATINITLSEATNFDVSDLAFSGGSLSDFTGSGTSYSVKFTPTANSTTAGSVSVASSTFIDAAGNSNADGTDTNNSVAFTIDTITPTVELATATTALKAGETATINITLSEVVTGFDVSDLAFSGGSLSNFSGTGTSYSVTFTADSASKTTAGSVSVASSTFIDAAGNSNADGDEDNNSVAFIIDNVAPTFSSGTTASVAENSGTAQVVYTASADGTGTAISSYSLKANTGDVAAFSINGSTGAVSLTANPNHETKASYSFTVIATDGVGNTAEQAVTLTITDINEAPSIDTTTYTFSTLSASPSVTVAASDPDGASSGNAITGYSLANEKLNGTSTSSAVFQIDNAGKITLTSGATVINNQAYSLDVTVTDGGGLTETKTITLNIQANTAPTFTNTGYQNVSSTVSRSEIDTATTYDFAATDVQNDSISYSLSGTDASSFTISTAGVLSFNSATDHDYETTTSRVVTVTATDSNNASSSHELTVNLTDVSPSAPVFNFTDTGSDNADKQTNNPALSVTVNAATDSWVYSTDSGVTYSTASVNGDGSLTLPEGVYNAGDIKVKVTDTNGETAIFDGPAITVDTTAPSAPTGLDLATADDTGSNDSDNITKNASGLTITGTAEANSTVELFNGTTSLGTTSANGSGQFSTDITLAEGTHSITTKATDVAGNTSTASNALSITFDNTVNVPVINNVADDNIINITENDGSIEASGTAEPNATINITDGIISPVQVTADNDGNWSYNYTNTISHNVPLTLTATATDVAGNVSSQVSRTFNADLTAPTEPVIDNSNAGDGTVNKDDLPASLSGTAEVGSTISITGLNGTYTATVGSDGTWSLPLVSSDLVDGSINNYTITATDTAGNSTSTTSSYKVDTSPVVVAPTQNSNISSALPDAALISNLGGFDSLEFTSTPDASNNRVILTEDISFNSDPFVSEVGEANNGRDISQTDFADETRNEVNNISRSTSSTKTIEESQELVSVNTSASEVNAMIDQFDSEFFDFDSLSPLLQELLASEPSDNELELLQQQFALANAADNGEFTGQLNTADTSFTELTYAAG